MTTTTLTKTARTVVSSSSNAAGATTRGTLSLVTAQGGILTMKITNGATGPTIACTGNVMIAHNATTPTAASAGADWKTLWSFSGLTTNNGIVERSIEIGPGVMQLEAEFTDNTAQAVTVEAFFSEITDAQSV